ncbi:DUF2752 domain-containing protein [Mumia sp. zg.B17]|uniref:DUF2752 domain-containing protein n=1 Tax=Mumia sp. zg.B17 TaxID=2855446 RepID=UPI001C6F2ED2|nr:DUF2752 domain-containing protein [Mumia sp. zg.B17]MBW9206203.1 DUF2752 domain-containing protein [Mumia sp. zg.B17]
MPVEVPPRVSRWRALRTPALVGAGGIAAAALLHFRDPNTSGSYGFCPFQAVTGWACPGCGGLRAVHALTDLDVGAALSSNVLAVLLVTTLAVAFALWIPRRLRDARAPMIAITSRVGVVLIVVGFVFTVVRNTPWGSSLAP